LVPGPRNQGQTRDIPGTRWCLILGSTPCRHADLPMGRRCNICYFCRLIFFFIKHLREPLPNPEANTTSISTSQLPTRPKPSRRSSRWRDYVRLLPHIDDFFLPTVKSIPKAPRAMCFPARPPRSRAQPQERTLETHTDVRAKDWIRLFFVGSAPRVVHLSSSYSSAPLPKRESYFEVPQISGAGLRTYM
jgi:hypothetical protein